MKLRQFLYWQRKNSISTLKKAEDRIQESEVRMVRCPQYSEFPGGVKELPMVVSYWLLVIGYWSLVVGY